MAKKSIDWFGILSAFVQDHPKTSAIVAFNLGVIAANAAKKAKGAMPALPEMAEIPSKLIDLVPSITDMKFYAPALVPVKALSNGHTKAGPRRGSRPRRNKTARRHTKAKAT